MLLAREIARTRLPDAIRTAPEGVLPITQIERAQRLAGDGDSQRMAIGYRAQRNRPHPLGLNGQHILFVHYRLDPGSLAINLQLINPQPICQIVAQGVGS